MNANAMNLVPTELHLTLQSTTGRVGTQRLLPAGTELVWSAPGEDAIVSANFQRIDSANGEEIENIVVDGAAWRVLHTEDRLDTFVDEARNLRIDLEDAMNAALNEFQNKYRHCNTRWSDEWSCEVDDECPVCGADISPYESVHLRGLMGESDDGVLLFQEAGVPEEA
jgi:hypothetical protein